jgi:hypothetical protein
LNPTRIAPESRVESESLDTDGFNFASWYRHLSQERTEDLPKLFERLSKMLPGFRALKTVSAGKGGQKRELVAIFSFGDTESKYEIDFDDLSDGERATIILVTPVPTWSIESWLLALLGDATVDESESRKRDFERRHPGKQEGQAIQDAAQAWRGKADQIPSVPSLADSKTEMNRMDLP